MKANSSSRTFPLEYRHRFSDRFYTFLYDGRVLCLETLLKELCDSPESIKDNSQPKRDNITWEGDDQYITINYRWGFEGERPIGSSVILYFVNLPSSTKIVPYES
jgi:hypothetical protein